MACVMSTFDVAPTQIRTPDPLIFSLYLSYYGSDFDEIWQKCWKFRSRWLYSNFMKNWFSDDVFMMSFLFFLYFSLLNFRCKDLRLLNSIKIQMCLFFFMTLADGTSMSLETSVQCQTVTQTTQQSCLDQPHLFCNEFFVAITLITNIITWVISLSPIFAFVIRGI